MNKIPNRQAICHVLNEHADTDKDIVVLCSDSRGSASLAPFAEAHPEQFVEVGIAEQNLVSISAGMAKAGKKPFAASPACFLSTRSYEQAKVDVAYSDTNVKLIGISGGISYGALGMSHHSAQDFAAMCAIPNMRVYVPSDRHQTKKLIENLLKDEKPAYIRVGRNPVEDIYTEDMYCLKPLDEEAVIRAASRAKAVITVEEHAPYGGLGSMVSMIIGADCPKRTACMALPDAPVITGTSKEVFDHYGLNKEGIAQKAVELLG